MELEQKGDDKDEFEAIHFHDIDFISLQTPINGTPKNGGLPKSSFFGDEFYVQIQKHVNSVRQELNGVEKSARAASERNQEQERQLRVLRENMESQKKDLDFSWQQKLDEKETEKVVLQERLTEQTNARLAENNARLKESTDRLAEVSKQLADAKLKLAATTADLELKTKEMDECINQSEEKKQGLVEALEKLASERHAEKLKAEELSQTVIQLSASVVKLETDLSVLKQERLRVEESHNAAIKNLHAQFEIDRLKLDAEHETRLTNLKADYEKQRSEINAPLQTEINELKRANAELQQQAQIAAKRVRFAEEFWIEAKKESEEMLKNQFEIKIREFKARLVQQEDEVHVAATMADLSKNNNSTRDDARSVYSDDEARDASDAAGDEGSTVSSGASTTSRRAMSTSSSHSAMSRVSSVSAAPTARELAKMRELVSPLKFAGRYDRPRDPGEDFSADVISRVSRVDMNDDGFEREYMTVQDHKISWQRLFAFSYTQMYHESFESWPRAEWVRKFLSDKETRDAMKRLKGSYQRNKDR
jgi:myosin heavy subunit